MTDKKSFWESAGRAGLVLGLVSTAYFAIGILIGKVNVRPGLVSGLIGFGSFALWAVKLIACIALMRMFMKGWAAMNPDTTGNDSFRFGSAVALLSALVYSGCYLAYTGFISPDFLADSVETVMQQLSPMMDSNSRDAIDEMLPRLPAIAFFSNLCWCFLFGTVLSAILSRNIPGNNPFAGNGTADEQ